MDHVIYDFIRKLRVSERGYCFILSKRPVEGGDADARTESVPDSTGERNLAVGHRSAGEVWG